MRNINVVGMSILLVGIGVLLTFGAWALLGLPNGATVLADDDDNSKSSCKDLPDHGELTDALEEVVDVGNPGTNGGLANDMWTSIVDRDGVVCGVTFSGDDRGDQWPISRVVSAQKANTANSVSLPPGAGGPNFPDGGLALSTANLFSAVQPGGSLFGLQHSNPVDTDVAYGGNSKNYGRHNDPMVGKRIGGVNVFGGGLALYGPGEDDGDPPVLLGAVGVSGDTSCTDHIVAWKIRDALGLDNVLAGVAGGTDNIIHDIAPDANGHPVSTSGFGHPACDAVATGIANALPGTHPIGP